MWPSGAGAVRRRRPVACTSRGGAVQLFAGDGEEVGRSLPPRRHCGGGRQVQPAAAITEPNPATPRAADHRTAVFGSGGEQHERSPSACAAIDGRGAVLRRYWMPLLRHLDQCTGLPVRKPRPYRDKRSAPGDLVHSDIK